MPIYNFAYFRGETIKIERVEKMNNSEREGSILDKVRKLFSSSYFKHIIADFLIKKVLFEFFSVVIKKYSSLVRYFGNIWNGGFL